MDWANERYVRLYTRDTITWKLIGWEGRAILPQLLRKVDRAGVLELGGLTPAEAVAAVIDAPIELVETAMQRILARGAAELGVDSIIIPKFIDAQEEPQSDAQRARECRARRRDLMRSSSRTVTPSSHESLQERHTESRGVTPSFPSDPSSLSKKELQAAKPPAPRQVSKLGAHESKTAPTWAAYADGYQKRYGRAPIRNARTNSQMARLLSLVPVDEAPSIARHYMLSENKNYRENGHPVWLLVRDAEKLAMETATGKTVVAAAASARPYVPGGYRD